MSATAASSASPARSSVLTLHAVLRAGGLVLSGPLVVLGFVIGLGVQTTILVVGLDLLVWGTKSPPLLDHISWRNVPVLGGMSRPKMIAAAGLGFVFFIVAAAVAAPLSTPPAATLSLTNASPAIGRPVQAQLRLSGNVYYAIFRDGACTKWRVHEQDARRRTCAVHRCAHPVVRAHQPGRSGHRILASEIRGKHTIGTSPK